MKYIICFLLAFGASCVSARKYHRTAQIIVNFAQKTVDSIYPQEYIFQGDTTRPDLWSKRYRRNINVALSDSCTVTNYYDVFIGPATPCNQYGITVFWDEGKIRIIDFKTKDTTWNYRSDTYKRERSYNSPAQSPKK